MTKESDIIDLVSKMRTAQKEYFRMRVNNLPVHQRNAKLHECKQLEKQVDEQLEIINGTKMDF